MSIETLELYEPIYRNGRLLVPVCMAVEVRNGQPMLMLAYACANYTLFGQLLAQLFRFIQWLWELEWELRFKCWPEGQLFPVFSIGTVQMWLWLWAGRNLYRLKWEPGA